MATTGPQRRKAFEDRQKAMGLKRVQSLFAHHEDIKEIRAYAAKLVAARIGVSTNAKT